MCLVDWLNSCEWARQETLGDETWEDIGEGLRVGMGSRLVPYCVLFESRRGGGFNAAPLDASHPHSVEAESPWQSNSLIGVWRQMRQTDSEGEKFPAVSLIEWQRNGAYTPSRGCYINKAAEETKSSRLLDDWGWNRSCWLCYFGVKYSNKDSLDRFNLWADRWKGCQERNTYLRSKFSQVKPWDRTSTHI